MGQSLSTRKRSNPSPQNEEDKELVRVIDGNNPSNQLTAPESLVSSDDKHDGVAGIQVLVDNGNNSTGNSPEHEAPACEPNKSPMDIDMVLKVLFSFCSVSTLKNVRLVSMKWKDLSLQDWRKKAILQLIMFESGMKPFAMSLQQYEKYVSFGMSGFRSCPFRQLRFLNFNLSYAFAYEKGLPHIEFVTFLSVSIPQTLSEFTRYMRPISPFKCLQVLELHSISADGHVNVEKIPVLPSVKRLKISQNHTHLGKDFTKWKIILQMFPNLEALSLAYVELGSEKVMDTIYKNDTLQICKAISEIRNSSGGAALSLKELEVIKMPEAERACCSSLDEGIIRALLECNLPLQRLSINFGWYSHRFGDEMVIKQLLEKCKDNLQYLRVWFPYPLERRMHEVTLNTFPTVNIQMTQLREVSLTNGLPSGLFLLAHLELPSLEKLKVEHDDRTGSITNAKRFHFSFPKGRVYEKVNTFEFVDTHAVPELETVKTFARIMPNLVNLTIPLDKQSFRIVCSRLTCLKSLNVLDAKGYYEELDDEAITGFDKGMASRRRGPNITNLKHLMDLQISCRTQILRNDLKFTEFSASHGFLQLPNLFTLSIGFKQISENVKTRLLAHVKGNVHFQDKENTRPDYDHFKVQIGLDTDGEGGHYGENEGDSYFDATEEENV